MRQIQLLNYYSQRYGDHSKPLNLCAIVIPYYRDLQVQTGYCYAFTDCLKTSGKILALESFSFETRSYASIFSEIRAYLVSRLSEYREALAPDTPEAFVVHIFCPDIMEAAAKKSPLDDLVAHYLLTNKPERRGVKNQLSRLKYEQVMIDGAKEISRETHGIIEADAKVREFNALLGAKVGGLVFKRDNFRKLVAESIKRGVAATKKS